MAVMTRVDPRTVGRALVTRRGMQGGGAQGPALRNQERWDRIDASGTAMRDRETR